MLIISIVSTVVWLSIVPFSKKTVASAHYTRMTVMVYLLSLVLGILLSIDIVEIYHSLFYYTPLSMIMDSLLYVIGVLVLVCFSPLWKGSMEIPSEYSLIFMFSILGASIIISSQDLISIYVALELQSFGLYILASIRTDQKGSTHAGLKYFLLGAMSSAFILLGISIIYQEVGSTGFQNIQSFVQVEAGDLGQGSKIIALGLLSILCGFMFKISAAPFHSWFSDVIQGVPTYTSIIIINLPKISIFTFLFHMLIACGVITSNTGQEANYLVTSGETFMIITTLFSLILGTVAGLKQTKIKRLLAFSTISHVGFILIALTTGSEASLSAIIFYVVQYTLTVVLTFLALMAYEMYHLSYYDVEENAKAAGQVNLILDLQGTGQYYKLLTFTFVLCLFSMAGIPPLTGFYAKLGVLNSSILQNISLIFITAIICSVISAAYYLKVIKVLMFDTNSSSSELRDVNDSWSVSPIHSYTMAVLTAFLCLFILDPELIINCTELVALSLYIT